MNLYDIDINKFEINILKSDKIILSDYNNNDEKKMLEEYIYLYKKDKNFNLLEKLHSLIESEVIFSKIWSIDVNETFKNIKKFNLDSVYGSSFLHEMIKCIKNNKHDYYDMIYKILSVKYFKTKEKANEYFETFIDTVKHIDHIDLNKTKEQREKFINLFDDNHVI
jgi:hypothetical protein